MGFPNGSNRCVVILGDALEVTDRDLIRTVVFFETRCDAIRNQHYYNVRMYRICEHYNDVYVSYFRLSYDIIFNIYNKNDIFEPK